MSRENEQRREPERRFSGPRVFALAILALGVVVLVGAFGISAGGGYSLVGPGFFPLIVAAGLLLFGFSFLVRVTVSPDAYVGEKAALEARMTHWPTVGLLLAALVGYAFLLDPLGYVVATGLFFPVAAYILGHTELRRVLWNLAPGLAIGVAVFFSFTELLGIRLPDGLLDPFL